MAQMCGLTHITVFVLYLMASFAAPPDTNFNSNRKKTLSHKIADIPRMAVSDTFMMPNDIYTVTAQRSQEHEYQPVSPFNAYHHTPSNHEHSQNNYGPYFPEAFSFDQLRTSLGLNFPYNPLISNYASPLPKISSNSPSASPLENHHTPLGPNFPYSPEISSYITPNVNSYPPTQPPRENLNIELLGSGNFGVIRGGTFYPDDELPLNSDDGSDASDYIGDASNSHDESNAAKVDFIDKYTYPEEQFEHFRDFAELSSPIDGAFSRFSSIHTINNASILRQNFHPKNIFEQLEQIDREKSLAELKKFPQTSKSKTKLVKTKLQKRLKTKLARKGADYDPLVALS